MRDSIVVTGGAGFIGSNLALKLKGDYPEISVLAVDNLKRAGSEINLRLLKNKGVNFTHCDVRNQNDFKQIEDADLVIHAAAEPSVLAGYGESPENLIDTNLNGTVNVLEFVRKENADLVYLSSSRIYPFDLINNLNFHKSEKRFELEESQSYRGVSLEGISEEFPIRGHRSFYGATKLSSEFLIQEYIYEYGFNGVINRCGLIAGPLQMGKKDQGVVTLWVLSFLYGKELKYIGFDGEGRQVRDVLHMDDLYRLILDQLNTLEGCNGEVYNVGGGTENSVSLRELTEICEEVTDERLQIGSVKRDRPADIPWYITDNSKVTDMFGWEPHVGVKEVVEDISDWILSNKETLRGVLD